MTDTDASWRYRLELITIIHDSYSLEEFRTLCAVLQVRYDDLPGEGLAGKVRELTTYLARKKRLLDLVDLVTAQRAEMAAPLADLRTVAETSPEIFEPTGFDSRATQTLNQGLVALSELAQDGEARAQIAVFHNDLARAQDQVNRVTYFKRVHDNLQQVEVSYAMLNLVDVRTLAGDPGAWVDVEDYCFPIMSALELLLAAIDAQEPATGSLTRSLGRVVRDFPQAVEAKNLAVFERALQTLQSLLSNNLSYTNGLLLQAARDLPLASLVTVMTRLHQQLEARAGPGLQRVADVAAGVGALDALNESLASLSARHDRWQEMDDELRHLEISLRAGDLTDLQRSWPLIQDLANGLYPDAEGPCGRSLQHQHNRLNDTLNDLDNVAPARVLIRFDNYRKSFSHCFREVDTELLRLCEETQKIAEPLAALLRDLQ